MLPDILDESHHLESDKGHHLESDKGHHLESANSHHVKDHQVSRHHLSDAGSHLQNIKPDTNIWNGEKLLDAFTDDNYKDDVDYYIPQDQFDDPLGK